MRYVPNDFHRKPNSNAWQLILIQEGDAGVWEGHFDIGGQRRQFFDVGDVHRVGYVGGPIACVESSQIAARNMFADNLVQSF